MQADKINPDMGSRVYVAMENRWTEMCRRSIELLVLIGRIAQELVNAIGHKHVSAEQSSAIRVRESVPIVLN
jgi:hypothetical protein